MPQQVGKFDFSGIPAAGAAPAQPQPDFTGIAQTPAPAPPVPAQMPMGARSMPTNLPDSSELLKVLDPNNWPVIGATLGGILGGAGGTAFGVGFGGVPGAVGGAALGGAGGEALKQNANRVLGRSAPPTMTEAATEVGTEGAKQGAIEFAGGALTRGAAAGANAVYRGYLKPALNAVDLPKARQIVTTALREALPISKAGEDRAKRLITELNKQVGGLLDGAAGGRVDLRQIADKVRTFAREKYYRPGVPTADYDAALKVADEIDAHPSLTGPGGAQTIAVNPKAANKVKQGLDTAIGDAAFGAERGAATEARKRGRHAAREAIEGQVPQVGALNAREAEIIDALEAVQQASGREANRNPFFGVPSMLSAAAGVGYGTMQDPISGALLALTTRGLVSAPVASRIAILADRFSRVPGTAPATAMRMAVQAALAENQRQQPNQGQE